MKGTAVIELRDVHTGKVQTVREDNIVTNIFRDFFTKKPLPAMGDLESNFTPIWQKMLGGLFIFGDTLEEDPDKYYPPSTIEYVGYANTEVNSTTDTKRGSINTTESGAVDGGYKFVWDFTTSQANGEIKSLALTHWLAGRCGPGSAFYKDLAVPVIAVDSTYNYATMFSDYHTRYEGNTSVTEMVSKNGTHRFWAVFDYTIRWMDYENNLFYTVQDGDAANKYVIRKYRYPLTSIGLIDSLETPILLDTITIQTNSIGYYSSFNNRVAYIDGGPDDPYFWIIESPSASQSATGTYVFKYLRIKKSDLTYAEGSLTIPGINFNIIGYRGEFYGWTQTCVIRNGYLYLVNYAKNGYYKVNLSNGTDVTFLNAGFTLIIPDSYVIHNGYMQSYKVPYLIRGYIRGYNFYIDGNDNIVKTPEGPGSYNGALIRTGDGYGHCLTEYNCYRITPGYRDTSDGNNAALMIPTLDVNYLATINNLAVPVTKTASQTMKITYTITEDAA